MVLENDRPLTTGRGGELTAIITAGAIGAARRRSTCHSEHVITYSDDLTGTDPQQLHGFFQHWAGAPDPATHLRVLEGSSAVVLAQDEGNQQVVGFITAITDGVLCAYIPLLEVLPEYQNRGIGSELLRRMLRKVEHLYMVDLMCDPEMQPFYERVGMQPASGMMIRNWARQAGS